MQSEETLSALSSPDQGRTGIGWGLLLTVLSWLACRMVVGVSWGPARNPLQFEPGLWGRWDTFNYAAIAQNGRTFGRCDQAPFVGVTNFLHATWCGTAQWMPGYPWLIRGLETLGITLANAGLLISWTATATALFLVWFGWCRDLRPARSLLVMVGFGVFPGAVYNFALFPTSTALAFAVGAVLAATRERFLIAAVLMTAAGLCYPSAWPAAAGLAIGMVLVGCTISVRQGVRRGLWGLAGLASLVVLEVHDQMAFGHANAYFLESAGPVLGGGSYPGSGLVRLLVNGNTSEQKRMGPTAGAALAVQGVVALGTAFLAATLTARHWFRQRMTDNVYPAAVGLSVVLFMATLNANAAAWNRSVVLAAPCVICLRKVPMWLLLPLVAVTAVTTALVSQAFFAATMV